MFVERGACNGGGTDCCKAVSFRTNEALTNGFRCGITNESVDPSSGESKDLRTYKRRRHGKSSSESILLEYGRVSMETASHLAGQESDACGLGSHGSHLEERQLLDGTQLTDKLCEGFSTNRYANEAKHDSATTMCRRVLSNILASEKFAMLSKLLSENFKGDDLFSMCVIDSKMREGVYERAPVLFSADIQQVWKKFQCIGNEMVFLARSLSDHSMTSYAEEFCAQSHAKPENPKADGVYGIGTCNQCGETADEKDSLVCDHCEGMYHMSCIEPVFKEIPRKSWYCFNCMADGIGPPHENCVVCERLNVQRTQINNALVQISVACEQNLNNLEENSSCDMDDKLNHSEEKQDAEVCRVCGNQVMTDGKFITCDHPYCPHKYYHLRCLTMKQLKIYGSLWYCPSCLCRECLTDKDDDNIVLCDGCDDAYHIYCMKPALTLIPEGKWFCKKCEGAIRQIRRAKRAYEKVGNLQKEKSGDGGKTGGNFEDKPDEKCMEELYKATEGMDMLLNAANTLSYQELTAATYQMKD